MSVVAYRNGILAADTLWIEGNFKSYGTKIQKLCPAAEWILVGGVGAEPDIEYLKKWYLSDRQSPPQFVVNGGHETSAKLLVVVSPTEVDVVDQLGYVSRKHLDKDQYMAIGSGYMVALAAMHNGASAAQAVQTAIELEAYCGGSVECLSIV